CDRDSFPTERRRSRTYPAWGCQTCPVLKTGWATGPVPLRGERSSALPSGGAPEHALVADPAREAVRVEALEEKLGGSARAAEQVAEAGQRDPPRALALLDEHAPCPLVGARRDREPVADLDEPAGVLEEAGEATVLEADRVRAEPRLELCGLVRAVAEPGRGARAGELRAAPFEAQERRDLVR